MSILGSCVDAVKIKRRNLKTGPYIQNAGGRARLNKRPAASFHLFTLKQQRTMLEGSINFLVSVSHLGHQSAATFTYLRVSRFPQSLRRCQATSRKRTHFWHVFLYASTTLDIRRFTKGRGAPEPLYMMTNHITPLPHMSTQSMHARVYTKTAAVTHVSKFED